ncbi:MAG: hypothetical protein AB8B55_10900 [Mariniblastus sp.]
MQKIVGQLKQQIAYFIEQRSDLALLIKGDLGGLNIAIGVLREYEKFPSRDLFLLVGGVFTGIEAYADEIVNQVRNERDLACDGFVAEGLNEEGDEALPELPADLDDKSLDPLDRIKSAIQYSSSLLPKNGGHRLVVGITPMGIVAAKQFHQLIESLCPTNGYEAWMRNVRIVFYDHSSAEIEEIEETPGLQTGSYDFSQQAIQDALYQEVEDESLPDAQRVNALHQLAIFDHAYNRPDEAHEKFDYLLGYYQGTNDLIMQSLVMHGKGEAYRKERRYEDARHWLECAILPAEEAESPHVLQHILRSLAELESECGNQSLSQSYSGHAQTLATANGDVSSLTYLEGQQAQSMVKQGDMSQATKMLEESANRSRELELETELEAQLELLENIYDMEGDEVRLQTVRSELSSLREGELS